MSFRTALCVLLLAITLSIGAVFITDEWMALGLTRDYTRMLWLALTGIFIVIWWAHLSAVGWSGFKKRFSRYFGWQRVLLVAFALLCGLFSATRQPRGYKVLADEYVLSVEAQQLHREGLSQIPLRSHIVNGIPRAMGSTINKRPPLFVFLLSITHDVFGYDPDNVFALNFFLTILFFLLLVGVADRFFGLSAGFAAGALWVTFPLLYQNATGAGFEILNLVAILATICAGAFYYERPSVFRLRVFVMCGLFLANCRYESMLFVVPVAVLILVVWLRNREARIVDAVLLLAPFVMAFSVLRLRTFTQNAADNWQVDPGQSPFSIDYFFDNLGHALNYFFPFSRYSTGSELLFGLGLGSIFFYFYGMIKGLWEGKARPGALVFVLMSGVIVINLFVLLVYHWGQLTAPEVSRLVLPFGLVCSFAIVYMFYGLGKSRAAHRFLMGGAGAFLGFVAMPRAAVAGLPSGSPHVVRGRWSLEAIQRVQDKNILVASQDAHLFAIYNIPSLSIELLNIRLNELAFNLRAKSFSVFVVQQTVMAEDGSWEPVPPDRLHPAIKTEEISATTIWPYNRISVARVVAVDEKLINAPFEASKTGSKEVQERRINHNMERSLRWMQNLP